MCTRNDSTGNGGNYLASLRLWSTHQDPSSFVQVVKKLSTIAQDVDWNMEPKKLATLFEQKNAFSDDPWAKWILEPSMAQLSKFKT